MALVMRIPSFEVVNQRGVALAKCVDVPRLMVIAGPNGSGKSTLLNAIRSTSGYSNVIYVGPHRAMRKQQVQQRYLYQQPLSLETLLAGSSLQNMEGIRIFEGNRDPWGYDEAANYLKYALCQIEVDRSRAITARVDRDGGIAPGSIPDAWKPFRDLTSNLLPHLKFERIDSSNRNQVQVLFRVHHLDTLIDLDELSSGEKSIIQMFYPMVERHVKTLVSAIDTGDITIERRDICVLIDEPELHLHPNLQVKVLDYMRLLASSGQVQVIVATHSPTIVESATFDELYLLRPVDLVKDGDNQLIRVAADDERLAALRSLFGTTNNLTAMLPLLVVEGTATGTGRTVADRSVYRALHPGFDRVTLIAGGGKNECRGLARSLSEALATFSASLKVTALLDRDTQRESDDHVTLLPVSMIENFMLDPDVLFEAIESVRDRTRLTTLKTVIEALDGLLAAQEDFEVGRRTAAILSGAHFHPPSDVEKIREAAILFGQAIDEKYSDVRITEARMASSDIVSRIKDQNRRREEFDGKRILKSFFNEHLRSSTLSVPVFTFYAARRARHRTSVIDFFDRFFEERQILARHPEHDAPKS
jgi:ABC-type hemin transport system ATPase subunit